MDRTARVIQAPRCPRSAPRPIAETERFCFARIRAIAARATLAAHALDRARHKRIDRFEVMRVTAALDKGAHRARCLGLAEQHAMRAAPEDLAELPGVVADV